MSEEPIGMLVMMTIAILLVAALWIVKGSRRAMPDNVVPQPEEPVQEAALVAVEPDSVLPESPELPQKIVIGDSPDRPLLTIEPVTSRKGYMKGRELDTRSGPFSRLAAIVQAAPSVLVAGKAHGKRLMEITIKGDLVRASDGNGLRAIAMSRDGIKGHGRLFDLDKLRVVINAAAVWQVASVIVAQKHLADINEKLEEIKGAIHRVSEWLANWRNARLNSIYDYFHQVAQAIHAGELSGSVRQQLEACERDLVEIFDHLAREFEQELQVRVEHKEWAGTRELTSKLRDKLEKLDRLARDMQTCLTVRVAGWHLLGMYPGEPQLVQARRASIERSCQRWLELARQMQAALATEISGVRSKVNWRSTLNKRRGALTNRRDEVLAMMSKAAERIEHAMKRTDERFHASDRPTRILVEVQGGAVIGAREAAG
jgi:hypothetical protein